MTPPDVFLHAVAALVTAGFAGVIFHARPVRASNLYLAAFLALIAGNQAFEALRNAATDPVREVVWFKAASVCAALDPAALLLFASRLRPGSRLDTSLALLVGLAPGVALALVAGWPLDGFYGSGLGHAFALTLSLYTALVYVFVAGWALRALTSTSDEPLWSWMFPALSLVALFAIPRVPENLGVQLYGPSGEGHPPWLGEAMAATIAAALALALGAAYAYALPKLSSTPRRSRRRVLHVGLLGPIVLITLFQLYRFRTPLASLGVDLDEATYLKIGQWGAAVRWLAFGALASVAVLRHDALRLDVDARRRAARVLIALALLVSLTGTVALGPQWLRDDFSRLPGVAFLLLGGAVVVSQGFRSLVDRVAHRAYGVPMPGDAAGRHDVYRAAVVTALAEGRAPMRDAELGRLREQLGIDDVTAGILEQVADASTSAPVTPGQIVGRRYHIRSLIGRGGHGRAFLARDTLLSRDVVVKEVFHGDAVDAAGILAEARIAGAIEHPHVVRVYDVLPRPGAALLVQELVSGGTLDDHLRRHGAPPLDEALDLVERVLEGLAAVHARGVVHRDLKPANVLLDEAGAPKICDFGIAESDVGATRPAGTPSAGAGGAGTPGYAAPEQLAGQAATPATDVYATGRLLRACLRTPVPPALDALIVRAMAADPAQRPADAGEMLRALREARTSLERARPR